jgi:hypothetical protein
LDIDERECLNKYILDKYRRNLKKERTIRIPDINEKENVNGEFPIQNSPVVCLELRLSRHKSHSSGLEENYFSLSLKIETIATIVQLMSAVPREDRSCQTPQHTEKEKKTDSIQGKTRTMNFFLS